MKKTKPTKKSSTKLVGKPTSTLYRTNKAHKKKRALRVALWLTAALILISLIYGAWTVVTSPRLYRSRNIISRLVKPAVPQPRSGAIISAEAPVVMDGSATKALIMQANKSFDLPTGSGISKRVIRYTSQDEDGREIAVYARVYLPQGATTAKKLPIFAFAPGTTGIDDHCAASLEKPAVANWANYDSLMAAYAAQGYAVVITDYEGMRDPTRIHHYMVGVLEGRAVLDSVRALKNLPASSSLVDDSNVFVSGYSQGGHAALWADKIAGDYAPELKLKGVVGFGPVSDVQTTLADITKGANINWFGPFVLYSYQDYYRQSLDLSAYLLPRWEASLSGDIATNCINTVLQHWGRQPAAVYQPGFLGALYRGDLSGSYAEFGIKLAKNRAGDVATGTAKRINHGKLDNVVLPTQSEALRARLCSLGGGGVSMAVYPTATHYDTMVKSYNDTLAWMRGVASGQPQITSCR